MPKISNLPAATAVNSDDLFVVVDRSGVAVTKKATAELAAMELLDLAHGVKSDISSVAGSQQISNIILLTQAQYDSIVAPDATTMYVIKD